MSIVVQGWQTAVGVGSLIAVLVTVAVIVSVVLRGSTLSEAVAGTWLSSRQLITVTVSALAGWLIGVVLVADRGNVWRIGLLLSLAGAILFVTLYWFLGRKSQSVVIYALLLFLLPVASSVIVTQ